MIAELFARMFSRASSEARALGLWKEHRDIAKRHARVQVAWAGHLAESRAMVLEVAREVGGGRCLVIGAGDCLDVPVAELAGTFAEVVLADVVIGREVRQLERRFPGRVRGVVWDASGALAELARRKDTLTSAEAVRIVADANPGPPPGGEADLVVSANCVSQLGLVPGHSLPAYAQDKELPERMARAAGKRHIAWLRERRGVRLLLADAARLDVAANGQVLKRETLYERFGLEKPAKIWRWDLAPIPEWSAEFHRVHEVGAWVWPLSGGPTQAPTVEVRS